MVAINLAFGASKRSGFPPLTALNVVAEANPTAENLAFYLLHKVCPEELIHTGVTVTHVRVWETENCYADACIPERTFS